MRMPVSDNESTKNKASNETIKELSTAERLLRSFGPLAGGLLIDFADLATFGTVGLILGPIIGGLLGWWLATIYRFGLLGQCVIIAITAAYCAFPGTGLLPLATLVFALIRFRERKKVDD